MQQILVLAVRDWNVMQNQEINENNISNKKQLEII